MRRDNRGISLVEILVVVAIMAVLGGVGIWGINAMTGKPAQQCAQKIVYSLERHRTTSMSKVEAKYKLVRDPINDRVFYEEYIRNDLNEDFVRSARVEIGDSKTKVQYLLGSDPTRLELPLELAFDRSSGSFKTQTGGGYCTKIIIMRGGREYEVTLVPLTGKVYTD